MFAQTLALRFGIPDFWTIVNEWPPSLVAYWEARYLLEPWDAENTKALRDMKYRPPDAVLRSGRFMTGPEILNRFRGAS